MPGFRAASAATARGFTATIPVSGELLLAAVGSLAPGRLERDAEVREAIRAVLADQAMVEGYDAAALLYRANLAVTRLGLGQIDALALMSRAEVGVPASVSGAGSPEPLVVTRDHLSAPARHHAPLAHAWAVVLGAQSPEAGPFSGLLSPEDVRRAIALLEGRGARLSPDRTMLAVTVASVG
jgi:hypothetical protein